MEEDNIAFFLKFVDINIKITNQKYLFKSVYDMIPIDDYTFNFTPPSKKTESHCKTVSLILP